MSSIFEENLEFWRIKNVYNARYYDFMSKLLTLDIVLQPADGETAVTQPSLPVVQLAVKFALGTLVHAREKTLLQQWVNRLIDILRQHVPGSEWLLHSMTVNTLLMRDLLLGVEDKDMRNSIMNLVLIAVRALQPQCTAFTTAACSRGGIPRADVRWGNAALQPLLQDAPAVVTFIEALMGLLFDAQKLWRRFTFFLKPVVLIATDCTSTRAYMLMRGYLARLVACFLGQDTPYPELVGGDEPARSKVRAMTDGYVSAELKTMCDAIGLLARSVCFPGATSKSVHALEPCCPAGESERNMMDSAIFFYKIIKQVLVCKRCFPCSLSPSMLGQERGA
jgi:hypothetical protein